MGSGLWPSPCLRPLSSRGVWQSGPTGDRGRQASVEAVELRVRESSAAFPDGCEPRVILGLLIDCIQAFNEGEQDRLQRFFGPGFRWYSVTTSALARGHRQ